MALDISTTETSTPVRFLDLVTTHQEIRAELDAIWDNTVSTAGFVGGAELNSFEEEYAAFCGTSEAIGVANGTDALELILAAAGIGPGDEVIIPANTFIATAEAVASVGATCVFADVDPDTMLITGDMIRAVATPKTAAVMAVHLYGQMVDATDVGAACSDLGIAFIEDSAQAHGAKWDGARAGSVGLAAGFSFYPGKNLGAMGDGGAITTNDAQLAAKMRSLSNHGRSLNSKYEHDLLGRNSRLDSLQAAALRVKLRHIDRWNQGRRNAFDWYGANLPDSLVQLSVRPEAEAVHHLGIVRCVGQTRDEVAAKLDAAGIGWGIHYPIPCHLQAPFGGAEGSFPISERLAGEIISLPMHPHLTEDEVLRVCEVVSR